MFFHMKPDMVLDFKTFDTLSTFTDPCNGLALLYFTRFPKTSMFLCQKYQDLLYH